MSWREEPKNTGGAFHRSDGDHAEAKRDYDVASRAIDAAREVFESEGYQFRRTACCFVVRAGDREYEGNLTEMLIVGNEETSDRQMVKILSEAATKVSRAMRGLPIYGDSGELVRDMGDLREDDS